MCKRPASGPSPAKKAKKAKTAYELWKKEQPEHAESGGDDDDTPDLGTMPDEELSHVIKLLGGDPKVRAGPCTRLRARSLASPHRQCSLAIGMRGPAGAGPGGGRPHFSERR